jgi:hypothetical protein
VVRTHFGKVTIDVVQIDNVHLLLEQLLLLLLLLLLINVAEKYFCFFLKEHKKNYSLDSFVLH